MTTTNLDLFKQALTTGLSNKIDRTAGECATEIECSKKHNIAMRTIMHGKIPSKRTLTPKMKWIIAVILSAALILTGCCISKLREKIGGFIIELFGLDVTITYEDEKTGKDRLYEVYEFSYVPDGYVLKESHLSLQLHNQIFVDDEGNQLICNQGTLVGSTLGITGDGSDSTILSICGYTIYHRSANGVYSYIWNDGDYAFHIFAPTELSFEELTAMVNGLRLKSQ